MMMSPVVLPSSRVELWPMTWEFRNVLAEELNIYIYQCRMKPREDDNSCTISVYLSFSLSSLRTDGTHKKPG